MRRFLPIILTMSVLCACATGATKAYALKLGVKSAAVMDYKTGKILFEQNPYRKIPPASITKIMTMYLVWEAVERGRIKLTDKVRVSKRADRTGGSTFNLRAGERVTVRTLLKGMAAASGNDACIAVAEHMGGVKAFVAKMNRKAKALGMIDTTFKNPHGLPAKGQVTTARDMLKLAQSYLKHFPYSLKYHSIRSITHNGKKRRNSNRLLGNYKGADGIKTGWINASGYNIVATAKRGNKRLIAVVLGGKTWRQRNKETKKVLDACFSRTPRTYVAKKPKAAPGPRANTLPIPAKVTASYAPAPKAAAGLRGGHAIQESSWKSRSEAEKRAATLRRSGMPARIVRVDLKKNGVWHRVMIGKFANRREAESYKRKIAKRYNLAHAIIR